MLNFVGASGCLAKLGKNNDDEIGLTYSNGEQSNIAEMMEDLTGGTLQLASERRLGRTSERLLNHHEYFCSAWLRFKLKIKIGVHPNHHHTNAYAAISQLLLTQF